MKVQIIADVHANYQALLAVLRAESADEAWCLSDLVAFGPHLPRRSNEFGCALALLAVE
jgi:hypothetical protein